MASDAGAGDLQPIGLSAVFQGYDTFMGNLENFQTAIGSAGDRIAKASQQMSTGASNAVSSMGTSIGNAVTGILDKVGTLQESLQTGLANAMMRGVTSGILLVGGLAAVTGAMISLGTAVVGATTVVWKFVESISAASERVQEGEQANQLLASRYGETAEAVSAATDAVKSHTVGASQANDVIATLAKKQIDMAKAGQLATVAQDAAALSGKRVSEAMAAITQAVSTGNSKQLEAYGIYVDSENAFSNYAKSLGRTPATLNDVEKSQAIFNQVLKQGSEIAGAWAIVMDNPLRLMERMQIVSENTSLAVGDKFTGALKAGYGAILSFKEILYAAITNVDTLGVTSYTAANGGMELLNSVSGRLAPILETVAGVIQVAGEEFGNFGQKAVAAAINLGADLAPRFEEIAEKALGWGINVSAQFAQGLVEGAVAVLTTAMDFIGGMLEYWLAPGSPPRVAPGLTSWGISAMTEFLHGFTQADFSVLSGLESTIDRIFSQFKKTGEEAGISMQDATAGLIESINKLTVTGKADYAIVDILRNSLGQYGAEVAELTKLQLDLAVSMNAVAATEKRLKDAAKAEEDATTKAATLVGEYNKLVREGASPAVLRAKKAEVDAALAAKKAAKTERVEAQKALKSQKEVEQGLSERVKLQEQLINQLLRLNDVEKQPKAAKAPTGPKTNAPIKTQKINLEIPKLKPAIDQKSLDDIRNKLGNLFKPWSEAGDKIRGKIDELAKKWQWFSDIVSRSWQKLMDTPVMKAITGFFDKLAAAFPPTFVEALGKVAGAILIIVGAVLAANVVIGILSGIIAALTSPIGLVIAAIALLVAAWEGNWLGIRDIVANVWGWIQQAFKDIVNWLSVNIPNAVNWCKEAWDKLVNALTSVWNFFGLVKDIIVDVAGVIGSALNVVIDLMAAIWTNKVLPALTSVWNFIVTSLQPIIQGFETLLRDFGTYMVTVFSPLWEAFLSILKDVWSFIVTSLEPIVNTLRIAFENVWNVLSNFVLKILTDIYNFLKDSFIGKIIEFIGENGLLKAFERGWLWINDALEKVHKWLEKIKKFLDSITIPPWLQGNSPPPMADWLGYISEQASGLVDNLGNLQDQLSGMTLPDWLSSNAASQNMESLRTAMNRLQDVTLTFQTADKQAVQVAAAPILAPRVARVALQDDERAKGKVVTVNFGGVNISNGMDQTTFEYRVRKVVRESLR